jgi:L-alanine-DL-glutamate epimerase-like enolase superfamily enzyme
VVSARRLAVERGAHTVKVKLRGPNLGPQLPVLERIRDAIGRSKLRLDANGSFGADRVLEVLDALRGLEPELVEEPTHSAALVQLPRGPVPLGLDESLQDPEVWGRVAPCIGRLGVVAVVLKPTTLGGFSQCLALGTRARELGLDVTISHTFDGPIALAAAAHLAIAIASRSRASGLDRHAGLAAWPETSLPMVGQTTLKPVDLAGLGVELEVP